MRKVETDLEAIEFLTNRDTLFTKRVPTVKLQDDDLVAEGGTYEGNLGDLYAALGVKVGTDREAMTLLLDGETLFIENPVGVCMVNDFIVHTDNSPYKGQLSELYCVD